MLTHHILTEVDTPNVYAFQIRGAGGKSLYLSDFEFRDPEIAEQHASHMLDEMAPQFSEPKKAPAKHENVVSLRDKKNKRETDEVIRRIGQEGLNYIYTTASFTDPIITRVVVDLDLNVEQKSRLDTAVDQEMSRIIQIAEKKLADCRAGFVWLMMRHPGEIPPRA